MKEKEPHEEWFYITKGFHTGDSVKLRHLKEYANNLNSNLIHAKRELIAELKIQVQQCSCGNHKDGINRGMSCKRCAVPISLILKHEKE